MFVLFEGKVVPVLLSKHDAMKAYWRSGGIDTLWAITKFMYCGSQIMGDNRITKENGTCTRDIGEKCTRD
jgi:hypothetical protein